MRKTTKTLATLASLALLPTTTAAHEVRGPYTGTVTATTTYPSGTFHGAVDIASGNACNYWGVQTGVVGSTFWDITIRTTTTSCYTSGISGTQNEAKHLWADGWVFRLWHFNKSADSVDKTCDRCQVGNEGSSGATSGPQTHLQQDKSGTLDTSWYSGYTVQGEVVSRDETLGYLD